MTDLEYMICEAERCGEIDLDTRDEMIGIITESRASSRAYEELEKKRQEYLINYKRTMKKFDAMLANAKTETDKQKIKAAIKAAEEKKNVTLDKFKEKMDKHDKDGYVAMASGHIAARNHNGTRHSNNYFTFKNMGIKYKDASAKQFMGKEENKKKMIKESVDDIRMEIYERELAGEITVEEREELLDYLDNSIME